MTSSLSEEILIFFVFGEESREAVGGVSVFGVFLVLFAGLEETEAEVAVLLVGGLVGRSCGVRFMATEDWLTPSGYYTRARCSPSSYLPHARRIVVLV